jgi:hypothetical protein
VFWSWICVSSIFPSRYNISPVHSDVGRRYRGADNSLARPTYRCILFDDENISFDASLGVYIYIYINSTNILSIMIINKIYEHQNLLSLYLFSFVVGLRTYQHLCSYFIYLLWSLWLGYCPLDVGETWVRTFSQNCSFGTSVGRNSSVGIATRYRLDVPRFESLWGRYFPHSPRPALGPIQPPIQWVPCLPGGKASGAWRWLPTPSRAEVKERVDLYLYSPSRPS